MENRGEAALRDMQVAAQGSEAGCPGSPTRDGVQIPSGVGVGSPDGHRALDGLREKVLRSLT